MAIPSCRLCGEPMPDGEEMFFYHGYSGPCPKPPLKDESDDFVAYLRFRKRADNENIKWLSVCNSTDEGAFKVYRRPK